MSIISEVKLFMRKDFCVLLAAGFCCVLLFVSFARQADTAESLYLPSSTLCQSLQSSIFKYSVGVSIGVSVPALISCFLDSFQSNLGNSRIFFLVRWLPLLSFLLSELFIAIFFSDCKYPWLYCRVVYMQIIVLVSTIYPFLILMCPKVWSPTKASISLSLMSMASVFRIHDEYALSFGSIYGILSFLFSLLSLVYIIYLSYESYVNYSIGSLLLKDINDDWVLYWALISALVGINIAWVTTLMYFLNVRILDFRSMDITILNYSITAIVVFFSTLHDRRLRQCMIRTQVTFYHPAIFKFISSFHILSDVWKQNEYLYGTFRTRFVLP